MFFSPVMPTVPSPVAKNTPYSAPYNLCNEFEYVPPVEVTASTCIRYSYSRGQSPLSTLQSPVFSTFRHFLLRLLACQLGIIYDFNHFLIAFNVQRFSGKLPLSGRAGCTGGAGGAAALALGQSAKVNEPVAPIDRCFNAFAYRR